ncbi:hypothetical protein ABVK25_007388 [Lepraria finkii]|uniref:DUF427 domain-containing protein n=1 Tax=Lepraria finkii TaxID=1340010 RepID=A0ABR4B2V3_9LECA
MSATLLTMPPKPKLNVHSFPRPPLLEKTPRHLQVKWKDQTIVDTKEAYWVLETTHPPTYYLPRFPHYPTHPLHALLLLRMERKSHILEHQIRGREGGGEAQDMEL